MGDVLIATERYILAAASYQEAFLREALPGARVKLFRARWRAGRTAEARAGIEAWLEQDPDNPLALRQLAKAELAELLASGVPLDNEQEARTLLAKLPAG